MFGGPTVPPPAPGSELDVYCPPVGVIDGGAALQSYGGRTGDPSALRNQIALSNFARECVGRPDGATLVKVGIEGRALLGPARARAGASRRRCASSSRAATGSSPRAPAASR
jgi:hypothetical protein